MEQSFALIATTLLAATTGLADAGFASGLASRFARTFARNTNVDVNIDYNEILASIDKNHNLINSTTPELILSNGYPAEVHHVTTEDGYILEMHRIPHGLQENKALRKRPVAFLHHCLLCSSSDFIMNTKDKALAYLLADNGYDVWLTNARGNTYSRRHVSLSPNEEEFWQFSWHEMGYYDLPAAIDYVLAKTGESKVNYIGFSMGTTVYWVLMSERPEYASKIRMMVAMAPVAYVKNLVGPLRYISWFSDGLVETLTLFGHYEVLSFHPVLHYVISFFCDEKRKTAAICQNALFMITGSNPEQLNKEFLPIILSHTPAGTSARTLHHYVQGIKSGGFRKFDFGVTGNLEAYGSEVPPSYNLSRATPPVALFWSHNDWLASPKDVLHLLSDLPNVVHIREIEDEKFTHLDFVWAIQADELLYQPMLEVLSNYQNKSVINFS